MEVRTLKMHKRRRVQWMRQDADEREEIVITGEEGDTKLASSGYFMWSFLEHFET